MLVPELDGKVAVVTGSARGIGAAIADAYLKGGAKTVVLLDVNPEGNETARRLCDTYGAKRAVFFHCDVTKDLDRVFEDILKTYPTVDILVNNAGVLNESNYALTVEVNLKALIGWSLKFWERTRKDQGGSGGTIVNVASLFGVKLAHFTPTYHATKFGAVAFSCSLGHKKNYEDTGVKVLALCPGFTRTELPLSGSLRDAEWTEFMKSMDWQETEGVARAAVDILAKESGSTWIADGGRPLEMFDHSSAMIS